MLKSYDNLIEEMKQRLYSKDYHSFYSEIDAHGYDDECKKVIEVLNMGSKKWLDAFEMQKRDSSMLQDLTNSISWEYDYDETGTKVIHKNESKSLRRHLGYSHDDPFSFEEWFNLIYFEDKDEIYNKVTYALKFENNYDIEYQLIRHDGTLALTRSIAKIIRRKNGTIKSIYGLDIDISSARVEKLFKTININSTRQIKRKDDVIYALKKMFFAVYHYNLNEDEYEKIKTPIEFATDQPVGNLTSILDFFVQNIVDDESTGLMYEFLNPATLRDRLKDKDFIAVDYKSLRRGWCRAYFIPYALDNDNKLSEALFVVQSIDENKKKEIEQQQQLKKAMIEATKANKAKSDFISRMSHDIRTPMNGIVGLTKIGMTKVNNPMAMKDILEKISLASDQLLSLINDVLDMDKISSGQIELEKVKFSVLDLIENNRKVFIEQILERDIRLMIDVKDVEYPIIIGSPLHLQRILANIVSNAVKFNRINGLVKITLLQKIVDDNHCVMEFKIRDSGYGMDGEFLSKIFEPFSQGVDSTLLDARTTYKGTGLGMTITKKLVDLMDGDIQISSVEGRGTCVSIKIPFEYTKENNISLVSDDTSVNDIMGKRILLVEDNLLNAEIAEELLQERGAIIEKAENGKIAIDMFMKNEEYYYDCILMDIRMPVLNGMDATRIIRSLTKRDSKTIPIFALTADSFLEDVIQMKEVGMNEHFAKPLNIEKITKAIHKYCIKKPQ